MSQHVFFYFVVLFLIREGTTDELLLSARFLCKFQLFLKKIEKHVRSLRCVSTVAY